MQTAWTAGAPLLVIQPVDADAAGAYVDAAHKAGAKVIAFDRLINTHATLTHMSRMTLLKRGGCKPKPAIDRLTAKRVKDAVELSFC